MMRSKSGSVSVRNPMQRCGSHGSYLDISNQCVLGYSQEEEFKFSFAPIQNKNNV
jgi:hypothetical protein